jgi:hypothetical protein
MLPFLIAASGLALVGCDSDSPIPQYRGFVGVLSSVDPETSELFVRRPEVQADGSVRQRTQVCLVTSVSEVYINGMVRPLSELEPGDEIEVLGYSDRGPFGRMVVAVAHVNREQRIPPPPDWLMQPQADVAASAPDNEE